MGQLFTISHLLAPCESQTAGRSLQISIGGELGSTAGLSWAWQPGMGSTIRASDQGQCPLDHCFASLGLPQCGEEGMGEVGLQLKEGFAKGKEKVGQSVQYSGQTLYAE